nr:response regulator [Chloroflexota bacterium]
MKRILVVEDETTIAQFLKRGLTYKGFEVLTTGNGGQAFTVMRTFTPDLVILDVILPDMNGIDMC